MYTYSSSRKDYEKKLPYDICVFCNEERMMDQSIHTKEGAPIENEFYRWVINAYPKFDGHTMLLPKRHIVEIEEERKEEVVARHELLLVAKNALLKVFENSGIEIFLQTGSQSASSIEHLHWHVVPARLDDPLRSFEKLGHFYTTDSKEEKVVLFPTPIMLTGKELQSEVAKVL
tara:strand:+ start:1795 stop:2316 length:522 start_codon:yes stop_codon:yes gene_type:complete